MPYRDDNDADVDDWESPESDNDEDSLTGETAPCPACGCDVYEDADYCPICGQAIMPGGATAFWSAKPGWYKLLALAGIVAVLISIFMMSFPW